MLDPKPAAGEVRIQIATSGVNPGDIKKRQDSFGLGMAYPRVIPHSDGAGRVDQVGEGVSKDWVGQSVWCYGAQSYHPFGTAAEFCTACRASRAFAQKCDNGTGYLPRYSWDNRSLRLTAGDLTGSTILVQGAAGSVGLCAVQLARRAGARVIGTVRSSSDERTARNAGADEVLNTNQDLSAPVKALAPDGIDHIVEVAFGANIEVDVE